MLRKLMLLIFIVSLISSLAVAQDTPATTEEVPTPAVTQEATAAPAAEIDPESIIADGLNNPRHLFYGSDGTLYIAEAGSGGDLDAEGPFGPITAGQTAQISAVSVDGEKTVILAGFVSMDSGFGRIDGATDIVVTDDSYWITLGTGTREPLAEGALVEAVVQIDRETGEVVQSIDMRAFEDANNPDEGEEVVSNPSALELADDGTLYIVDASGNSVFTWTEEAGLNLFAFWTVTDATPQLVPTSVDVGPDGDVYIGFLSGFPFPPGGARIERYNADGTLEETYEGLTLVTDVLVTADGTLYAVEMASGFGDTGYIPNSGRVITVSADGIEAVAEGLNIPYGLAQNPDGQLVVTVDSALSAPDSGKVIVLPGM
jgi:hypothetical protein